MPDYSHENLINHFKAMGYDLWASGVCVGVVQMSIQAFFAGREEFARFNRRLEFLAAYSPLELSNRIKKARETIAERSRKKRFESKLAEGERVLVDLSEEEELLTETEAFFSGVELYLQPIRHRALFSKAVPQSQVQDIVPFMESTALIEQGGMRVADSYAGIYSRLELTDYFNRLTQILLHSCPPCDFAMGVGSINHRISVLFDGVRGSWIMTDVNGLPPKELTTGAELADTVFESLTTKAGEESAAKYAALSTTVYAMEKSESQVKRIMQTLKQSKEFKAAHDVVRSKVMRRTGKLNASLAQIAARSGHRDLLTSISAIHRGSLSEGDHEGFTPLYAAAVLNDVATLKHLLDEGVSLETKTNRGHSPLFGAIYFNQIEAMTVLLDEDKNLVSAPADNAGALPLHLAAALNNVEAMQLLVRKGANPRTEFEGGWSLVATIAKYGSVAALNALLDLDPAVDLDKAADDATTPLMAAVRGGHAKIVEVLAEKKINLDKRNHAGKTALHLAVENKALAALEVLIRHGAAVDAEDRDGNTSLHLAARLGNRALFDFLVQHGASKTKTNNAGKTPVSPDFAPWDIVRASATLDSLLQKIAELQSRLPRRRSKDQAALEQLQRDVFRSYAKDHFTELYSGLSAQAGLAFVAAENDNDDAFVLLRAEEKISFETTNADGWVPLHMAALSDSRKIIDRWTAEGADPSRTTASHLTAAYLAAEAGHAEVLGKIIAHATPDILNMANQGNETPLYAAVSKGQVQAAQLLIEAGVNVNQVSDSGWTPIHRAIAENHFKIFEMLAEKADLNQAMPSTGMTPVALAAEYGRMDFLRILLGKAPPVDVRQKDLQDRTPLMRAIQNGHVNAAKMLIESMEAKHLNERDSNLVSALHLAIERNELELVQALILKEVDVNLEAGPEAKTPLQLAVLGHKVEIANLLLANGANPRKEDRHGQSALSRGTPLAEATARKEALFSAMDGWIKELEKAYSGRVSPSSITAEFAALKPLIENDFKANYEVFSRRYDRRSFGNNDHLLIAFIAAAKGCKTILEIVLSQIDVTAKNPAGLSLSQVAEAYHHSELARLLHDFEQKQEQKEHGSLSRVGLFIDDPSVAAPSLVPKRVGIADSPYEQLKKTILEEIRSIEIAKMAPLESSSVRHRKALQYIEIREKLAECDRAADKQADKYAYLKAQCEDPHSLLHYALHLTSSMDEKASGSASKKVFDKIAELDAQVAARSKKPDS